MTTSEAMLKEILDEFPNFRIVAKDGDSLSRAIDLCLKVLTLGRQRHYLTRYHTVLGDSLYVPPNWSAMNDVARIILLRHERVHLRQRRRYGSAGMALLYLLVFFPFGLAWGRARLEWEAYRETLRATADLKGIGAARDPRLRASIVQRFIGPDYAWMWPFRGQVEAWYDQALAELAREYTPTSGPAIRNDPTTPDERVGLR